MRSVCVLVPDSRGLEHNFHDVTIVDMGDLPESSVLMDELSLLRQQWPPAVLRHMVWLQQDVDVIRAEAKKRFRIARPGKCSYCNKWIKCDMYRHVATYHLDLAQLWRCLVSWCTVWKGTPQDCMDHVWGAHDVPCDVKSASLEQFVPPWTVQRQLWSDSLTAVHSGISTDVLLFSDINLSLCHHYRVHKRGLPHIAFRKDYLTRHRRRPGLGVRCCHQFRPLQCRRAMLALLSWNRSRPGEPDVPVVGCGQYESWRSRSVIFRL